MTFEQLPLAGCFKLSLEPIADKRGFFARRFDAAQFAQRGLATQFDQRSLSYNVQRGTVRGLHLQAPPHGEAKIVRCIAGAIFDVALDLRADSPTYGRWCGEVLSAANRLALYLPWGVAHGFQTLENGSEVDYEIAGAFRSEAAMGVRWDDPRLAISWPVKEPIVSEKDRRLPSLDDFEGASS